MEMFILEIGKKINLMEQELIYFKMVNVTKGHLKTE